MGKFYKRRSRRRAAARSRSRSRKQSRSRSRSRSRKQSRARSRSRVRRSTRKSRRKQTGAISFKEFISDIGNFFINTTPGKYILGTGGALLSMALLKGLYNWLVMAGPIQMQYSDKGAFTPSWAPGMISELRNPANHCCIWEEIKIRGKENKIRNVEGENFDMYASCMGGVRPAREGDKYGILFSRHSRTPVFRPTRAAIVVRLEKDGRPNFVSIDFASSQYNPNDYNDRYDDTYVHDAWTAKIPAYATDKLCLKRNIKPRIWNATYNLKNFLRWGNLSKKQAGWVNDVISNFLNYGGLTVRVVYFDKKKERQTIDKPAFDTDSTVSRKIIGVADANDDYHFEHRYCSRRGTNKINCVSSPLEFHYESPYIMKPNITSRYQSH